MGHASGLIAVTIAALAMAAPAAAQPACGETITEDTTLTADLFCDSTSGPPLVIGAPRITLDLGGHELRGDKAILNQGHDHVTIRNGWIRSNEESIRLEGAGHNVIRDIRTDGLIFGITVVDSHHTRIVQNTINSVSLSLTNSSHNVVANNVVTRFEGVISLSGSSHNRIVDNIVWTWRDLALGLFDSHHNVVRRNTLVNDTFAVVVLNLAHDNALADNTIASHGPYRSPGLVMTESSRNRLLGNTLVGVPLGVRLRSGADNVIRLNDLAGDPVGPYAPQPSPDGVLVDAAATRTLLQKNSVRGFDDDGIDVDAPGTRLRGNSADGNGDLGIEAVPGVIDLGGNTASGNGNPLQCTNVFCS